MNQSRNRNQGQMRQMNMLQKQFEQFVLDSQYIDLIRQYKLQSKENKEWEYNIVLFYDLIIAYFLKKYPQILVIQDDQLRLELKQYFFRSLIDIKIVEQENDQINKNHIIYTYNREINIAGFILKTPLGYVKNSKFMPYNNIMLNLYSKNQDIMKPYIDNRVLIIQILTDYFQCNQSQHNINHQLTFFGSIQPDFREIFNKYFSYSKFTEVPAQILLDFIQKVQGQTREFWEDQSDTMIIQYIQEKQLMLDLLKYIHYVEAEKQIVQNEKIYNKATSQIQRNIIQFKDYDKQFDLRVLQYLYRLSFGINVFVQKAKTLDDFYSAISGNLIPIMQEKLLQFKQSRNYSCNHHQILDIINNTKDEMQLEYVIKLLDSFQKEPQPEQEKGTNNTIFKVTIREKEYTFDQDMMICQQCSTGIICYHEIMQILLKYEQIQHDEYEKIIQPFMQRDMQVFVHNSFCYVCGSAFPLKIEMQQIYENLDPLKKYSIINKSFKILINGVITQFQLSLSSLLQDFIQLYYYVLKAELLPLKQQVNYIQKKTDITLLFISAYLSSIKGDNILVDLKSLYKYSKIKDLTFQQFTQQVQQLTLKFSIQSSIIIPSENTVSLLFANQFRKPIIGVKIKKNPQVITDLIKQNTMLYPSLYELDTYIPYFNYDIKTLSQDVINKVIEVSAVDIQNRSSSVVSFYQNVKNNYGRNMERNSTKLTNRYKLQGSYLFKQIPVEFCILNQKQQFYMKYCSKSKQIHSQDKECDQCDYSPDKSINVEKISDKQYEIDFFKKNQLKQKIQFKYPEIDDKLAFPLDYSNNYLYNLSKEFGVSYFQVVNFGGFSYLDISILSQFNTLQQLVEYQLKQFGNISQITNYSPSIIDQYVPKDLQFILKMQNKNYNWNLFNTRMLYIRARILGFLSNLGETSLIISIIEDFNNRYQKQLAQGNVSTNYFLNCQLMLSYLFQQVYPELKKQVNGTILQQYIKQMFKDDLINKDQSGEIGAFRLKTTKQVNAEALQAEMMQFKQDYQQRDIDEDNDYVDGYNKKNLLDDDQDYENED